MIGLILVATGGARYTKFVWPLLESAERFFPPHRAVLFTDEPNLSVNAIKIPHKDLGWPRATLMRYHAILKNAAFFEQFDHLFYCDIDCLFTSPIEESEICGEGITAVIHPGFPDAFERNPYSTAFVGGSPTYYQGCFVGGKTETFLEMCRVITRKIDEDDRNGIMAIWHDESHLNRYLADTPPAKALSPAYAFPEPKYLAHPETWMPCAPDKFVPKIRHLEKPEQGMWKNAG